VQDLDTPTHAERFIIRGILDTADIFMVDLIRDDATKKLKKMWNACEQIHGRFCLTNCSLTLS
jgi:hypothetical protein